MTDAVVRLLDEAIRERDELREQVARLERQQEDLRGTVAFWAVRSDRLRASLEKYGRHGETCGAQWLVEAGPCTCGFAEALTPPAPDAESSACESNDPTG